eukprot:157604-Amorphochlora_amoeboformis.AAC.1
MSIQETHRKMRGSCQGRNVNSGDTQEDKRKLSRKKCQFKRHAGRYEEAVEKKEYEFKRHLG